ncbi:MAG TPA: ankyrin repeat domain-containing protein [Steroidobacteraceae bacterium]
MIAQCVRSPVIPLLCCGLLLGGGPDVSAAAAPAAAKAPGQLDAARLALRTHQSSQAATLLRATADAGNPEAQYLLGLLYLNGVGVAIDSQAAEQWLRSAALQNHAEAAFVLAALLQSKPQPEAGSEAATWLQRSATLGYERARQALKDPRPLLVAERDLGSVKVRSAWAIYCARYDDVTALRALGRDAATARDEFGRSALSHAAEAQAVNAVVALLSLGADARATDQYKTTALMLAAQRGNVAILHALLAAGVDVNQADEQRRTALFYAVRWQGLAAVEVLLEAGASVAATDARGYSALDVLVAQASSRDAERIGALLRERGARQTITSAAHDAASGRVDTTHPGQRYQGWSALALAVTRNDQATVQSLLRSGSDLNQLTPQGDPLWRLAMDANSADMLKLLLANGASVSSLDHSKHSALVQAAGLDPPMLDILLSGGVSGDAHSANEQSALLAAVQHKQVANVRRLLEAKVRADAADSLGRTALMLAASNDDSETAQLLLAHGAATGAKDKLRRSALWYAAKAGAQSLLDPLVEGNDTADAADATGTTPLAIAAQSGYPAVVLRLLTAGAHINASDRNGDSPLMLAAADGHVDVVAVLLAHAAQIDLANKSGDTALMDASRVGAEAVCAALLQAGANRSVRNTTHATAGDIARQRGFIELAQLLEGRS